MPEESTETDTRADEAALQEVVDTRSATSSTNNEDADEDETPDDASPDAIAANSTAKKKKSKKAKLKKALGVGGHEDKEAGSSSNSNPASKLTNDMVEQLLEMNPSLKSEVEGMDKNNAAEAVRKMDVADLLTGMVG